MNKLIILIALVFICQFSYSQTILLEENVKNDTVVKTNGPNLKNFSHLYVGYGMILGPSDGVGSNITTGLSYEISLGYRYKRKICNFYAIGFDVHYNTLSYRIAQDDDKILPNISSHDKEKIIFHNWGAEVYNRFNFGKRGNQVGNFLDIGAYANWISNSVHYTKDDVASANINFNNAEVVEVYNKKLLYTEDFSYGVKARVGINRYSVFAEYRLSDLFKSEYIYSELPRLTVGVEIGIH